MYTIWIKLYEIMMMTTLVHTLLYGSETFNFNLAKEIIRLTVCFLNDTERFDESLI